MHLHQPMHCVLSFSTNKQEQLVHCTSKPAEQTVYTSKQKLLLASTMHHSLHLCDLDLYINANLYNGDAVIPAAKMAVLPKGHHRQTAALLRRE